MKKAIVILILALSSFVFAQDMHFHTFGFSPKDPGQVPWAASDEFTIANSSNRTTLAIPFTFPAEASLYWENRVTPKAYSAPETIAPKVSLSPEIYSIPSLRLFTYSDRSIPAELSARRIYNSNSLSPFVGYGGGVMFAYLNNNIGLNLDLSLRLAGNTANHTVAESMLSSLTFSYRIANNLFSYFNHNAKMNVFLQLSEANIFKLIDSREVASVLPGKSYYIKPGFSINTPSLTLEGLIRLPMNQSLENMTLNNIKKQEFSGSFGLKWYIPEN